MIRLIFTWTIVAFLFSNTINANCDLVPKFGLQTKGLSVNFNNKSLGDFSSVEWNFGDGEVSTDESPQHFYEEGGMFTFSITIANNEGCSETFESKVYVFDTRAVSPKAEEEEELATDDAMASLRPSSVTKNILSDLSTYPNPVVTQATVSFALKEESEVAVKVFDMSGRMVAVLANGRMDEGSREVIFRRKDLVSGTYLVNVVTADAILSDKIIVQ
ncbi:MAG: PKD domain-containing protein [Chitinophagales bacterium]